ncbi:PLP-dependent aspartate aminotransferase family protein [Kutzneria sp. 744]|uniref:trans-sulfuration enzyme family protein n=1 Tax=Kutzneria sp. (strain 744) TaxID=345341 RepID=UPI0003EEAB87|nr:PLP-dependent transferase [Kutzneria sp. 744]EWM12264.1 methionine-gamma-lyase [Kutzneria sp. 744]
MSDARPAKSAGYLARTRPVVPPIYQSATFYLDDLAYKDIQEGGLREHWYSRFANPTVDAAAAEIAALEGAEAALMTSSGMAAIATTLLTLLANGTADQPAHDKAQASPVLGRPGRIVAARQVYGDTRDLLVRDLPALGVDVTMVDATDVGAWAEAIADAPTTVVYAETLSNPQLDLTDLPTLARLSHAAGAKLVVDNTFATPYTVNPLRHGADVVVHSATKFLSGHSDVIAGVVVADAATVTEVQKRVITFGGCLDPHAAFLVWRGIQTFDLRLERSCATAARLASALAANPEIVSVRYPTGDIAARVMRPDRRGAMVAFTVRGGDTRALAVMRRLTVASEATSLGGVESLVSTPFNSSHFSLTPEERVAARIDDGMIRLSCGIEDPSALISDLEQALAATV